MKAPVIMEFKYSDTLQPDIAYTKNYGYSVLSSIYHELPIDNFLINRQHHSKEEFNANAITKNLESLRKAECSYAEQSYYLFNYYYEILLEIGEKFSIDFTRRIRSLGVIKKILSETKK